MACRMQRDLRHGLVPIEPVADTPYHQKQTFEVGRGRWIEDRTCPCLLAADESRDVLEWVPERSVEEDLVRQIDFDRLPAHVAVIMDGNGRWAARRYLPRAEGHRAGIDAVRDSTELAARLGVKVLTLYAFSVENWKRPAAEVSLLMGLQKRYLRLRDRDADATRHPVPDDRRDDKLPPDVRVELDAAVARTVNNAGMRFNIAFNYSGRAEIVDAARRALAAGIPPDELDEDRFSAPAAYRRTARSRSADTHQRRNAREQLPAVADRVTRRSG